MCLSESFVFLDTRLMNLPILAAANVDWLCYIAIVASVFFGFRYRHSFFVLPFVVAISLLAKDDFYPLSYFPMYSDPDESENYFYIGTWDEGTDPKPADIKPLPVRHLTGITAPKVKKMQKAWIRDRADELGTKDTKLPQEERVKKWLELLDYLREHKRSELPERLALVEVWIEYDKELGYRETPEVVAVQHP